MLIPRVVCGACLCALLIVSPAQAVPGWLAPQDLSAAGQDAATPQVAVDPFGNAVAVWERTDGTHSRVQAAVHPAGGAWQLPAQDLSASGQDAEAPQVALDPAGNAIAIWHRSNGTNTIVQGAFRPAGGAWQLPAQDLSAPGQNAENPQIAFDSSGNAVAVWSRLDGSNFIVQAAFRPTGGAWQVPAQDLSAVGADGAEPHVALDAAGNAVAVWRRPNGANFIIQAAVRPAGGPWQLPAQDLSAAGQDAFLPRIAVDPAGNAVAVWRRSNGTNSIVQAAARPAGGPWQLPGQDLSASGQNANNPQVAVDRFGNAVAVWQRPEGGSNVVQAALRPSGSAWLPAENLSASGLPASDPHVGFDSAGNAVAVWKRSVMQAAVHPAGGSWQSPVDLAAANPGQPELAVDPGGNAVAVWYRPDGANDIIQAAAYDATPPELRNVVVPRRGFARQRLTFSVDPFDTWSPLGPPVWNFGDGKTASGATVTHTFARRGSFTVTVTQVDAVANQTVATRQLVLRIARCFGSAATQVGSSGNDRIRGTRRADVIVALRGNDRVRGGRGKDKICGGKGRDRLFGEGGNDRLNGGPGRDFCSQGGGRGRLLSC